MEGVVTLSHSHTPSEKHHMAIDAIEFLCAVQLNLTMWKYRLALLTSSSSIPPVIIE